MTSTRYRSSYREDRTGLPQDTIPEDPLKTILGYQIYVTANERGEFRFGLHQAELSGAGASFEGHEKVDVARGAKIASEDRAENFELRNLPFSTEVDHLLIFDI